MGGMGVMGGDGRGVESAKVGRFMGWLQIIVKGMCGFRKRKGLKGGMTIEHWLRLKCSRSAECKRVCPLLSLNRIFDH